MANLPQKDGNQSPTRNRNRQHKSNVNSKDPVDHVNCISAWKNGAKREFTNEIQKICQLRLSSTVTRLGHR